MRLWIIPLLFWSTYSSPSLNLESQPIGPSGSTAGQCALQSGSLTEAVKLDTKRTHAIPPELISGAKCTNTDPSRLARHSLNHNDYVGAKCNDGTTPIYYVGAQETTSTEWIIMLDGDGECDTEATCDARATEAPWSVGSFLWPSFIHGTSLMSVDPNENIRLHAAHRAFLPYCSSDYWIGNQTNENTSPRDFHFLGTKNFQYTIQALIDHHKLKQATKVILSGSSAGAIGALNHAKWLADKLGNTIQVYVLLDGGWFLPLENAALVTSPSTVAKVWGLDNTTLLAKSIPVEARWSHEGESHLANSPSLSIGPCNLYASCFIESMTKSALKLHPPVLFLQSKFDMKQLHSVVESDLAILGSENQSALPAIIRVEQRVQSFGALMKTSLDGAVARSSKFSIWSPSCFQHEYLRDRYLVTKATAKDPIASQTQSDAMDYANVSLFTGWDGTLTVEIGLYGYLKKYGFNFPQDLDENTQKENFKRNISIYPGPGLQTTLRSSNYVAALTLWLRDSTHSRSTGLSWSDDCSGVGCNPTCSESIIATKEEKSKENIYGMPISSAQYETEQMVLRILGLVVLILALLCQIFMCYRDSVMFGKVKHMRDFDPNFGTESNHTFHTYEEEEIEEEEEEKAGDKEKENKITDSSEPEKPEKLKKQFTSISIEKKKSKVKEKNRSLKIRNNRPATFYAKKGRSNSETTAGLWAESKDGLSNVRRKVTLTTKNLVYDVEYKHSNTGKLVRKRVVNGINIILNPGELVAVMGPSGSGKTTLLDCIARPAKKEPMMKGDVFINGLSTRTVSGKALHSCSIGYVRQLTTPWDPQLTVLENLIYAARLRLPTRMPFTELMFIVSRCIAETDLHDLMDSVVGGESGGGISGGQKRLLSVALQLILSPAALIMDEPTSGLDAKKAMQLCKISRKMADQGKIVAITIHQPRPEIFCMFDRVIFLCAGSVVFQGPASSVGAYLLQHPSLMHGIDVNEDDLLLAQENPADTIIDGLGSAAMQQTAIKWYSDENQAIKILQAIDCSNERAAIYARTPSGKKAGARVRMAVQARKLSVRVALVTYTGRHVWRNISKLVGACASIFIMNILLTALLFRQTTNTNQVFTMIVIMNAVQVAITPGWLMADALMPLVLQEYNDGAAKLRAFIASNLLTGLTTLGLQSMISLCIVYIIGINVGHWNFIELFDWWVVLYANLMSVEMAFWTTYYFSGSKALYSFYIVWISIVQGFVVARQDYPSGLQWLPFTSSMYWGISGSANILLTNKTFCEYKDPDPDPIIRGVDCFATGGDIALEYFAISSTDFVTSLTVLFFMFLTFNCLSILGLGVFISSRSDANAQPNTIVYYTQYLLKCFSFSCCTSCSCKQELHAKGTFEGDKSRKTLEMKMMTDGQLPTDKKLLLEIESMVILPHEWDDKDGHTNYDSDEEIGEVETYVLSSDTLSSSLAPTLSESKGETKSSKPKRRQRRKSTTHYTDFKAANNKLFESHHSWGTVARRIASINHMDLNGRVNGHRSLPKAIRNSLDLKNKDTGNPVSPIRSSSEPIAKTEK